LPPLVMPIEMTTVEAATVYWYRWRKAKTVPQLDQGMSPMGMATTNLAAAQIDW
jgi:hypothetical protein